MKTVILTVIAVILAAVVAGAAIVYSGAYNVAASKPHWDVTYWILNTARTRSIEAHAEGIAVPAGFDDQSNMASAAGHFAEHCVVCHGTPGGEKGELGAGMYPRPPDLTHVSQRFSPAQLFWILKHGIKMSGMPSMEDDGDDMLWATVGLLEKLPGMSHDEFERLRAASQAHGEDDHHHDHHTEGH